MSDADATSVDKASTPSDDATVDTGGMEGGGGGGGGGGTSAIDDALETFVSRSQLQFRYLLYALAVTAVWWLVVGPMSAWVAGIGLVVLAFGLQRVVEAARSWRWPQADGVVASSRVLTEPDAREYAGLDPVEEADDTAEFSGGYVPVIEYEYTVDGTRYENAAISPFDDTLSRRHWAEALVNEYPSNSQISVRYDPDDPTRSYLRPWIRTSSGLLPAAGLVMLIGAIWFAAGMPGGAPVVPLAFGIPFTVLGLSRFITDRRSRNWPTATGTVTATGVDKEMGQKESGATKTIYVPGIQYEYTVDGTSRVSTRYALVGGEPTFDSRNAAEAWIEENHPMDSAITVHYDPDRPDRAVIEPGASKSLPTLLAGLAFTAIGVFLILNPSVSTL